MRKNERKHRNSCFSPSSEYYFIHVYTKRLKNPGFEIKHEKTKNYSSQAVKRDSGQSVKKD